MDLEVLEELKDIFLFNIKDIVLQLWGSGFVNVDIFACITFYLDGLTRLIWLSNF